MDTRDQLLARLSEIRIALENHEHIWKDWRIQAVRVLEETDLETLGVNIGTRKEPGS